MGTGDHLLAASDIRDLLGEVSGKRKHILWKNKDFFKFAVMLFTWDKQWGILNKVQESTKLNERRKMKMKKKMITIVMSMMIGAWLLGGCGNKDTAQENATTSVTEAPEKEDTKTE